MDSNKQARPSEEAELDRIHKRPKTLSADDVSGKLRMIFTCSSDDDEDLKIYTLDLSNHLVGDGSSFVPIRPTLRLDYETFNDDGFCVFGSTLFVFKSSKTKSVYSFDLSSIDDSKVFDLRLDQNTLTRRSNMNYRKMNPAAVPTPDGKKILVFSTQINEYKRPPRRPFDPDVVSSDDEEHKSVHAFLTETTDFELYDPLTDSWQVLPGLIPSNDIFVFAYSFINNSTFLIKTNDGALTLNLLPPITTDYRPWSWDTNYSRLYYEASGGPFFKIEDELLLTPGGVSDITRKDATFRLNSTVFFFPLPWFGDPHTRDSDIRCPTTVMTPLVQNGNKHTFCVVSGGIERPDWLPRLFVKIYSFDLDKFREDKKVEGKNAKLEVVDLRTWKFALDCHPPCRVLDARNAFYMPAPAL